MIPTCIGVYTTRRSWPWLVRAMSLLIVEVAPAVATAGRRSSLRLELGRTLEAPTFDRVESPAAQVVPRWERADKGPSTQWKSRVSLWVYG